MSLRQLARAHTEASSSVRELLKPYRDTWILNDDVSTDSDGDVKEL